MDHGSARRGFAGGGGGGGGEGGRSIGSVRPRPLKAIEVWRTGLRLHPTTGCQWCGIGSKGHATMRPRSKEKLAAVSTRGGGFAIGFDPFGLLAVCSQLSSSSLPLSLAT